MGHGREVDDRNVQLASRPPDAEVEHRQLFLEVGTEQDDRGGAVAVGDLGGGEAEHHLCGKAVAELRVDVVGADHALGEPAPHVRVLVGSARAAEHRDRARTVQVARSRDRGRGRLQRFRPRHFAQLTVDCDVRVEDARIGVDPLDPVAALVAEPAVVHRF